LRRLKILLIVLLIIVLICIGLYLAKPMLKRHLEDRMRPLEAEVKT
jgi:uncharacterized protein YneF (UPF0154 family)